MNKGLLSLAKIQEITLLFIATNLTFSSRYADIIVHRLLAVIIEKDRTYPELLDPKKLADLSHHINYRHKMAQYAGRGSSVITAIVSVVFVICKLYIAT